jgi:alpha-ketoglutarate-dependent taurine dioxygenase
MLETLHGTTVRPIQSCELTQHPRSTALPLVVEATGDKGREALLELLAARRAWFDDRLHQYGGLLFRGFDLESVEDFEAVATAVKPELASQYPFGMAPRTKSSKYVFSTTKAAHTKGHELVPIGLHNEKAYGADPPQYIFFFCQVAPPDSRGGETIIADSRKIYADIDPAVREKFEKLSVRYIREYRPSPGNFGFDMSWPMVFESDDRKTVEAVCKQHQATWEWLRDGSLRMENVRPATYRHPITGEVSWANCVGAVHPSGGANEIIYNSKVWYRRLHALVYSLLVRSLRRNPFAVAFGDGSPISRAEIRAVNAAENRNKVFFQWRKGDLLVLDNMLVAHGRALNRGGPRRILAAFG